MAATRPAKSTNGLDGQQVTQKGSNGCLDEGPEFEETARLLTLEEARCPVCLEILLEPVTMPCKHSVCLPCFKQSVEFTSLCCPLCRLRVSSWARRQSLKKSLINVELWDMVRQSYPEKCKRRMEMREGGGAAGEEKTFCKPGEIPQEYKQQQKKAVMNEEKRRAQSHEEMEEYGLPKHFKDSFCGVSSDLENEEPSGMRTRYVSAFIRKTRSSPPSSQILQNHVVQRSRSCTETEDGRGKDGCPSELAAMAKACITYSYNAGILLSSENSRSLSAPVLIPDKKLLWRGVFAAAASTSFTVPLTRPERSISPESNDSISEELNHFKPIVCSPCTPPKRLPDGKLLEPTIVKSTPRNLNRSLQKPTSYEASPTILQKWKQIEMDRQHTKVSSKGTITSPVFDVTVKKNSHHKRSKFCTNLRGENALKQHGSVSIMKADISGQEKGENLTCNKRRLIFDQPIAEQSTSLKRSAKSQTPIEIVSTEGTCITDCQAAEEMGTGSVKDSILSTAQERQILLIYNNCAEVIQCNQKVMDTQDQRNNSNARSSVKGRPTSRRGRKRSQKTKHLEVGGRAKKFRPQCQDVFDTESDVGSLCGQRLQQEKEDHKLALKLQRQFNMECKKVDRRKTSPDKYLLRSWVFAGGSEEYSPRRSVRIFKKS